MCLYFWVIMSSIQQLVNVTWVWLVADVGLTAQYQDVVYQWHVAMAAQCNAGSLPTALIKVVRPLQGSARLDYSLN